MEVGISWTVTWGWEVEVTRRKIKGAIPSDPVVLGFDVFTEHR